MNAFPWWHIACFGGGFLLAGFFAFLIRLPVSNLQASGVVTKSVYKPAHTTYMPMKVGKVTTMQPVHHPDKWEVSVTVPEIEIPTSMNTKTDVGQEVRIRYRVDSVEHALGNEE